MSSIPTFTLNNGQKLPAVGLGCWMGEYGCADRAYAMAEKAIKIGYRHIDTAAGYGNEEAVGLAIRSSGIPREEFFVTTKLPGSGHANVREALEKSLSLLDIDYIDLYLIHWPQATEGSATLAPEQSPTVRETWAQMEQLLEAGKVRSIGVSNFSIKVLEGLLPHVKVVPAVNQIELHPYLPQTELLAYLKEKGIHATAYSSLGQPSPTKTLPSLLRDDAVLRIAEKHGASSGQVLLSWGVLRGTSVIPKSETEARLRQNLTLLSLDEGDIQALDKLHTEPGKHRSLLSYFKDGAVFGWTIEQLGWNFEGDGLVPTS